MLWLAAASLAGWAALVALRGGFWRLRAPAPDAFAGPWPAVAMVVPARDEAGLVGRAAASLRAQHYGGAVSLRVVDDHSTDSTAAEARAAGAAVIAARPLPEGWTGKLWALAQGVDEARAEEPRYFFLTDADIVHAPGHLAGLVARAESGGWDLASHMVLLHCRSRAERALIPAFVFFFFQLYPPAWISNPRRRTAGAAGGSILIRASALHRAGGLAAIRGELIDDCALARAVKRSGGRVWLGLTEEARSVRPYSAGGVFRMISRTAYTQLRHSPAMLAGTVAGMLLLYAAPPVLALAASGPARLLGVAAWALMTCAYLPAVRFYGRSPAWAPVLPAAALFYVAATIDSAWRHWRGAGGEWKGRVRSGGAG